VIPELLGDEAQADLCAAILALTCQNQTAAD
jgi:hypothetical protein